MEARWLGRDSETKRNVVLVSLETPFDSYIRPNHTGEFFVCFCAMDARNVRDEGLCDFCSRLLHLGCAYLCSWGPDCERVHDRMDDMVVGAHPPQTYLGCVMTTWHADDSLQSALDFFLNCTEPDKEYAPDGCDLAVIVCVGSSEWKGAIEHHVAARVEDDKRTQGVE